MATTTTRDLATFKAKLRELMPELVERYHVKSLGIFGSYARGEQKKRSDLDVLVEYSKTPSLFQLVDLQLFLSKKLGVKVDLVMKRALRPFARESVLRDLIEIDVPRGGGIGDTAAPSLQESAQ
ncbi:MAG: nucleotidyltransferase family protein [Chloroflexi bacterium]|nr:nucleotidyltransferase family protein [Chloroflexota bacterium]